jgi:hypothetical protein
MLTIEDSAVSPWARLWGRQIQAFSPGMLIAALAAECQATGGQLQRAGTRSTALSQHCLCGQRVPKRLSQRTHCCPECGLRADRDIVSAVLAACVELADPDDPATARVDYELARALRAGLTCQQEDRAQSTGTSPKRDHRAGAARAGSLRRRPLLSNATVTRPTPEQTSTTGRRADQPNTKLHKQIRWKHDPSGSTLSPAASIPPASSAPAR